MDIEQVAPKRPNFLLVVILFCATILVVFLLAWLFLGFDGKHLTFRHGHGYKHPTSHLVLPAGSAPADLADIYASRQPDLV